MNEHTDIPDLKDPILITAFSSPQKGGATAAAALNYAIERWHAEPVTTFDTEGFYDYGRMRPWVRRDGDTTVVDWPQSTVYRVDAPEHSYLILVGAEPSMKWREFVTDIGGFAQRNAVGTAVNLKAVPGMVPHTLEAPLKAIYSDPQLAEEYGFQELEDQDGPADVGRILNLQLASEGCKTIDLYVMEPFYASAVPDAAASLSLLEALRTRFALAVDTEPLQQAAEAQRRAIDAAASSSEQLSETIEALERRAAGGALTEGGRPLLQAPDLPAEDLDTASVLDEADDILRNFGGDEQSPDA